MFALWEAAIEPVLRASGARRIVQISHGSTEPTPLLELVAEGAELDVIDADPRFDHASAEPAPAGRYRFHRKRSLGVLPDLPAADAALIDGDHNWFTVRRELGVLADTARLAGQPLPILILQDIGWPYGRRDSYAAPDEIPPESRQPYRRAGMEPGRPELVDEGGVNPTMWNAELEGGPRNGVLTALEDFLADDAPEARTVILPVDYGLAIVVDEQRLASPELSRVLDHLESRDGQRSVLQAAEALRLRGVSGLHSTAVRSQRRLERSAHRYLELLKGALLDEHYLENELRLKYLARCVKNGQPAEADRVRDPIRAQPGAYAELRRKRREGTRVFEEGINGFLPYSSMGRLRLDHLERCLDSIRFEAVPGDLVECRTGRGGGAIFMRGYLAAHELPGRKVWIADEFRATPAPGKEPLVVDEAMTDLQGDLNLVRDAFDRFDLLDGRLRFLTGSPASSLASADLDQVALLRLGSGIGDEAEAVLDAVYPKLAIGGIVVIDDHADPECARGVAAFRARHGITDALEAVDRTAVAWRKTESTAVEPGGATPESPMVLGLPLAPPAPVDAIDLTVVVVFYNMRREAARTLRSLSRAYQLGLDDVAYEVIVIDNGSDAGNKLDADFVASFGPEFRFIDLADEAPPSPVDALNLGIKEGRGDCYALMIDGAHILTPSVLHFGLAGLETYAPAIVATQPWFVGPGQQGDSMSEGYDQAYEDRLFQRIGWPEAGYRLFEIGHFQGGRDWLDGLWESNCLFVTREQLEQVGGFDENFSMAGGGFANLDIYERLGSSPDVTVVSIIGEASFHQLHGGVSTNAAEAEERQRRIYSYREHFAELRGRRFRGHGKPIHYVGRIGSPEARRSRARRLTTDIFGKDAPTPEVDAMPTEPAPIPEDLRLNFIEAAWKGLGWQQTTWLGRQIDSAPTDLIAYQEAIAMAEPDWIVELGTGAGGRTLFLASVCELLDRGQVASVDAGLMPDLPIHSRIEYIHGRPTDQATLDRLRELVGDGRVLLILGTRATAEVTRKLFEMYAPMVSVGSFAIVTDTIVNGHPVWTGFGPGPMEAVRQLIQRHGEFFADPFFERHGLTFNPGGFLKRTR